jgi:ATP-dependent DNA helicase RecG
MQENGSPPARFSTDDNRTYFLVEIPIHVDFPGVVETLDELTKKPTEIEKKLLRFIAIEPRSRAEIAEFLEVSPRGRAVNRVVERLLSMTLAEMTIPDKPSSRNQRYRLTEKGRKQTETG